MSETQFYQNTVVSLDATADLQDLALSTTDERGYHFICGGDESAVVRDYDIIANDVLYIAVDQAQTGQTEEGDANEGSLHRWDYVSGDINLASDTGMTTAVQNAVNYYMMKDDTTESPSSEHDILNNAVTPVIDEDGGDGQFEVGDSWESMLGSVSSNGNMTAANYEHIIEVLGSNGSLKVNGFANNTLNSSALKSGDSLILDITYELTISIEDNTEEGPDGEVHSAKTFSFSSAGTAGDEAEPGILRLRTRYEALGA